MKYLTLFFLLISNQLFPQTFTERKLNTTIQEVTVFLQGAQITRFGKLDIPIGKSIIRIESLSPHIDDKSIQVNANGNFTVLSINHKFNYLAKLDKGEKIDSLKSLIKSLYFDISSNSMRLEVLQEKQSLLNANKNLGGQNSGASIVQLKQALEFYEKELSTIKSEELKTRLKTDELKEQKTRLEQQIAEFTRQDDLPTGEIEIRIDSKGTSQGEFNITYLVANAGWYPKYDVRVENISKPLELKYKADVYQNTGVDWENVKMIFSNGNPNQSGVAPELQTWHLNYARNTIYNTPNHGVVSNSVRNVSGKILSEDGEPLPGANVVVKGSTIGTISDVEGNYSLTLPNGATHIVVSFIGYFDQEMPITSSKINIKMEPDAQALEEVVVIGYGVAGRSSGDQAFLRKSTTKEAEVITTSTIENQTTVHFEVETPYSIKSNGEMLSVNLNAFEMETIYEYYAVPKLDKDAFLIARIVDWDQFNLLEGEANLYFEDAYVGRSILNARSLTDTLNISLGRDKNIVIGRTKIEEFSKKRTVGSNKVESRGFEIIARNKKSQPIKLTLFDQIPVSAISDISVSATDLTNGKLQEKTGEVIWEIELNPQEQVDLKLGYEVKYPKRENVYLE